MKQSLVFFIISVSAQLSGGIILLLNFARFEDRFLQSYFSGSDLVESDDEGFVHLDDMRVKGALKRTRLSTASIVWIIIGYSVSIFGELGEFNKGFAFMLVILLTVALVYFTFVIVNKVVEKTYIKHCLVREEKVEEYGVHLIASPKEVRDYLRIKAGESNNNQS